MSSHAEQIITPIAVRTVDWADPAAIALRDAMTQEMELRYADRIAALGDHLKVIDVDEETVVYTGVAYTCDDVPVGHAALRWAGPDLELKRMFVAPSHRGRGVSTALLAAVEEVARELGGRRVILQAGDRQPDAVRLYERAGYTRIPIFPPYEVLAFSICMEKAL